MQKCETRLTFSLYVHFDCRNSLKLPSKIAMVVLFFVKYFPVSTIATTDITDMWHFGKVALDGGYSFITHFGQFICSYLRIQSNLIFYPFIKITALSITLGIILSITLSAILLRLCCGTVLLLLKSHLICN